MKTIELWLPLFWQNALFNNDFSDLTEDEKYAFMDFMDGRYAVHGTFSPISIDLDNVQNILIHDAMVAVKKHPVECARVKFAVDSCWRTSACFNHTPTKNIHSDS